MLAEGKKGFSSDRKEELYFNQVIPLFREASHLPELLTGLEGQLHFLVELHPWTLVELHL